MNIFKHLRFLSFVLVFIMCGCKDYNSLDSIEISPVVSHGSDNVSMSKYVCDSTDGLRQFKVTGIYDDDDTEDLTDEVTWTADSSGDEYLSESYPGMITCSTDIGVFGVQATYEVDNGVSDEGEEGSSSNLTDSMIIDGM